MRRVQKTVILFLVAMLLLSACNLPKSTATPFATQFGEQDIIRTAAAQTVEAMGTELASSSTPAPPTVPPVFTQTPVPNQQDTSTALQTLVSIKTNTPLPPMPSNTPTGLCDKAKFSGETIKDGTTYSPGATFSKAWTFTNDGNCTWDSNYMLVFISGDAMNAVASKPLTTANVATGQTVQISVDLTAPSKTGTFHGDWGLRNGTGVIFSKFWVEIVVPGTTYNFLDNMCKAEWRTAAGVLSCPGATTDLSGYVLKVDNPKLDGGYQDNESAIETAPQPVNNGYITGKFPAFSVTTGSHFKTVIGCLSGSTNCSVKFTLAYIADGGAQTNLKEWAKTNDGKFISVDEDLSPLAGKSVQFILQVTANGTGSATTPYWLKPRVQ
jgi:Ig-like domain from next to BRCA1 gene